MIVRTVMEVELGDRKVYVDSKVYNAIRHEGYMQGRADAIEEIYKNAEEKIKEQIEYLNQSPRNGKMWARYMITYFSHIKNACEQLKEQKND